MKIMTYPNPLARRWHGKIFECQASELPEKVNNRKVKVWVALTDDDWEKYGPIFYKKRRR